MNDRTLANVSEVLHIKTAKIRQFKGSSEYLLCYLSHQEEAASVVRSRVHEHANLGGLLESH